MTQDTTAGPGSPDYRQRNADAYRAGERAEKRGQISASALVTYKALVKACGSGVWTETTIAKLVEKTRDNKHIRTVQKHLAELRQSGLIRTECHGRRKIVTSLEETDAPEVRALDADELWAAAKAARDAGDLHRAAALGYQASMALAGRSEHAPKHDPECDADVADQTPDGSFFSPGEHALNSVFNTNFGSCSSFKEISGLTQTPLTPHGGNGGGKDRSDAFSEREETPDTPSMELLKAEGVNSAAEFAFHPLAEIRAGIAWVDRRPKPPKSRAALLCAALREGWWKEESHVEPERNALDRERDCSPDQTPDDLHALAERTTCVIVGLPPGVG